MALLDTLPTTEQVRKALGLWHKSAGQGSPLTETLLVQEALASASGNVRLATNQILYKALTAMQARYADEAALLRTRYLDAKTVYLLAIERNVVQATIYNQQQRAIELLTAIVQEMERDAQQQRRILLASRLPPSSQAGLVGVEHLVDHLTRVLTAPEPPMIVQVDGIGGAGKTALVAATLRTLVATGRVRNIVWISMRCPSSSSPASIRPSSGTMPTVDDFIEQLSAQLLPKNNNGLNEAERVRALQAHLNRAAAIVVLDDLEMVSPIDELLSLVQRLAGVSRFVLISRRCFYGWSGIHHLRAPELAEAAALQVMRREAAMCNLPELMDAPDDSLRAVYAAVGGNPLALRVVICQLHLHSLPAVLDDLATDCGAAMQQMYGHIYRQAWECLDQAARSVLRAMAAANAQGNAPDSLARMCQLDIGLVRQALGVLVDLNLIESRGDLNHRVYALSNLTRSWLAAEAQRRPG